MGTAWAIAAFYAGLYAVLIVALAWHVMRTRVRLKVVHGDGGNKEMLKAIRGHANAVETAPVAAILLAALAGLGTSGMVLHLLGALFLAARLAHGWYFSGDGRSWRFRRYGALGSFTLLLVMAMLVVLKAAGAMI